MSLLVTTADLIARRSVAGGSLLALARGLRQELQPLIDTHVDVPREKALLSRRGGRCEVDGTYLTFDPFDSRHRCPTCGREYVGDLHDRFRLYWYQLWLAERVLHASLLSVLTDDRTSRDLAVTLLGQYADQYLQYPNADNVLGPSRPFFSTYLESIWLLQLTIALSLLESVPTPIDASFGGRIRDRLIQPSAALIASYDEGMSNRQVWNNAALMAAGSMLGDRAMFEQGIHGSGGLHAHLNTALLGDGTWYEGENYHLFAHRGLWYGERLASLGGEPLPATLARRYREAFAAPFRTLLPDLTYPSRRDSQYAVSVRQLRFAESCELGLTVGDDERLTGMLARLYDPSVPRGETGRRATSADVERNLPATGLQRADLSWRTLLCARAELPLLEAHALRSDLLPAQGIGIMRRHGGDLYVSLDYGHSGGGHGHPDRLNLTLVDGITRWFDDPGTGSYVDPSLHWYRSTLAHSAPIVDGRSQPRVHGTLDAFEDNGSAGLVAARATLSPGLEVKRTVFVHPDYLVDVLQWESDEAHEITLPLHGVEPDGVRVAHADLKLGSDGTEDGFRFLQDVARVSLPASRQMTYRASAPFGGHLQGWSFASGDAALFTATAPAPPNAVGRRPLALLSQRGRAGTFVTVWSWAGLVTKVRLDANSAGVARGAARVHVHAWDPISLRGETRAIADSDHDRMQKKAILSSQESHSRLDTIAPSASPLPAEYLLGESHYRRSELTWEEAGAPEARVQVSFIEPHTISITVDVLSSHRQFISVDAENELDNEPAAINGDSVQLYALTSTTGAGVLLVPNVGNGEVDTRGIDGWANDLQVEASWSPTTHGYRLAALLAVEPNDAELRLDVVINETATGRARRRGQLVMSGASGEFVYLRGDRHDPSRLLRFLLHP